MNDNNNKAQRTKSKKLSLTHTLYRDEPSLFIYIFLCVAHIQRKKQFIDTAHHIPRERMSFLLEGG